MNAIKDSVHDWVSLDPVAQDLLDTRLVQRLRHIKQLSTVRLVYPSASHTRFEHSLGVYHLASEALEHLGVNGERAAHVRAAALLHDVGHGPYGHQTEEVIMRHTGRHHDEIADLLSGDVPATVPGPAGAESTAAAETGDQQTAGEVLREHDLSPDRVAALVRGEGELGQLVSGELDVDRMDYLVRDAHHTGVPYGTIDNGRLVRSLRYRDGDLVLADGNVRTAESLLLARALMNGIVYRHHVSRIAGSMLERAAERLLEAAPDLTPTSFRRMADHDLLVVLGEHVPDLGRRIEHRDLYKRAVWAGLEGVPGDLVDLGHAAVRDAEGDVAERAGVGREAVLLDVPPRPAMKESKTRVVVDGAVRRLEDASELVGAIRAAERGGWRLGVYAPEPVRDEVAAAAVDVLGLPDHLAE